MKIFYLPLLLNLTFFNAQSLSKIKITDFETGNPITTARVLTKNEVFYSNDDGWVLLPENSKKLEISAFGFKTEKTENLKSVLALKPIYKDIDEVKIVNIDIKNIFKDVFNNYDKRYYVEPSLYNIIYKQKNISNDKINFLFIFTGKLWSSDNKYNYKESFKQNYDSFVQIQIDTIRYNKSEISDNEMEVGALDKSRDFVGDIFFNYKLAFIYKMLQNKTVKYSANLINDLNNEQSIVYKLTIPDGMIVSGKFTYNKLDKVISHFEINYDQSMFEPIKRETKDKQTYLYKLGNGTVTYDFYKKGSEYFPSSTISEGNGFNSISDNGNFVNGFKREIIFQKFNPTQTSKLSNKIDLSKKIWENIPTQIEKDANILLSKEEQEFINDNNYEK